MHVRVAPLTDEREVTSQAVERVDARVVHIGATRHAQMALAVVAVAAL